MYVARMHKFVSPASAPWRKVACSIVGNAYDRSTGAILWSSWFHHNAIFRLGLDNLIFDPELVSQISPRLESTPTGTNGTFDFGSLETDLNSNVAQRQF